MPPLLRLYRRLLFSQHPLAKQLRHRLASRLGQQLYQLPYLQGQVLIDPTQNIGQHVLLSGRYEPHIIEIVQAFAQAGFSFVDVGANIGLHLLAAAFHKTNPQQQFVAFEPEPTIFQRLQANCALNQLAFVQLHQTGIGDAVSTLTIHASTDFNEGSHSLLARPGTAPSGTVPVTTLDNLRPNLPEADTPTLIKIDVEGFEPLALAGGQAWLSSLPNAAVLMEVSPVLLRDSGRSENELIEQLHQAGFTNHIIIYDSDTFLPDHHLINDYFNILCWKGEAAAAVYQQLPSFLTLPIIPPNAPDFVEWQRFSTVALRSASAAAVPHNELLAQLNSSKQIQELTFQSTIPLIAPLRRAWYSVAAKWGIRAVIQQQNQANEAIYQLLQQQQTQIDQQAQQIETLRQEVTRLKQVPHDPSKV